MIDFPITMQNPIFYHTSPVSRREVGKPSKESKNEDKERETNKQTNKEDKITSK